MRAFSEASWDDFVSLRTNGIKVNYWAICHRKLWLYARGLRMESFSDRVALGRLLHEETYRELSYREIMLDNLIKIDFISPEEKVLEVKHSRKLLDAARLQLAYYLMYLEYIGAGELVGEIRFPKERRTEEMRLTPEMRARVLEALQDIRRIEALSNPPQATMSPLCRSCAYLELCWG